ncbi:MAG: hypothetical protein R2708_15845 [Vicinamibacterales bacterium]
MEPSIPPVVVQGRVWRTWACRSRPGHRRAGGRRKPELRGRQTGSAAEFDLLCLHAWGAHGHPPLTSPEAAAPGNGLLLFFRVDDYDATLPRARALVHALEEEPHRNPATGTLEFSLRDRDGYYVTISAL